MEYAARPRAGAAMQAPAAALHSLRTGLSSQWSSSTDSYLSCCKCLLCIEDPSEGLLTDTFETVIAIAAAGQRPTTHTGRIAYA